MDKLNITQLKGALISACSGIISNEKTLTELDTIIGDGDHGKTMESGFSALKEMLETTGFSTVPELFRETGILLVRVMGGASGVIFGTLFIGGHEALNVSDIVGPDELIRFFRGSADAIRRRGRTSRGDKTMLDALYPAVEAMEEAKEAGCDIKGILLAAKNGAEKGAKQTEKMIARKGRSKNFREKGLDLPDPGAVSTAIIFQGISDYLQSFDF